MKKIKRRKEKPPQCSQCGKLGRADCSRVECANRKPLTANIGDGADELFLNSGCFAHKQKYGHGG